VPNLTGIAAGSNRYPPRSLGVFAADCPVSLGRMTAGRTGSVLEQEPGSRHPDGLVAVSLTASGWALLYALYRGYYGFGGTVGMIGTPSSPAEFRALNLIGAAVLLGLAVLPAAMLPAWRRPGLRRVLLAVCWVLAVGLVMHALVQDIQRVLSLAGALRVYYPPSVWVSVNRRAADVQDLALNETWFLVEGILWGVIGWIALGRSPARRWWIGSALAAIAVMTLVGMLTVYGVLGRTIVY